MRLGSFITMVGSEHVIAPCSLVDLEERKHHLLPDHPEPLCQTVEREACLRGAAAPITCLLQNSGSTLTPAGVCGNDVDLGGRPEAGRHRSRQRSARIGSSSEPWIRWNWESTWVWRCPSSRMHDSRSLCLSPSVFPCRSRLQHAPFFLPFALDATVCFFFGAHPRGGAHTTR